MRRIILPSALLTTTLVLSLSAQAAGSLTRTFVSSAGSDSNPCTVLAPCATFAVAYAATAANGIIAALDPGKYGPLTITGPITINGNGWAAITAPAAGNGITINAQLGDAVTLTGLEIDGADAGSIGIMFNSGKFLTVDNSVISDVTGAGIQFLPNAASELLVSNTVVANIGNTGIQVRPSGGDSSIHIKASLRGVVVYNNIYGIYVLSGGVSFATVDAKISDSEFDGSSSAAVVSQTSGGVPVAVMVSGSAVVHNATGCTAVSSGAVLRLTRSVLTGNTTSWSVNGGSVLSYEDNSIDGNGDGDPAPPTIPHK
jgi:Right handed beta helix region